MPPPRMDVVRSGYADHSTFFRGGSIPDAAVPQLRQGMAVPAIRRGSIIPSCNGGFTDEARQSIAGTSPVMTK